MKIITPFFLHYFSGNWDNNRGDKMDEIKLKKDIENYIKKIEKMINNNSKEEDIRKEKEKLDELLEIFYKYLN